MHFQYQQRKHTKKKRQEAVVSKQEAFATAKQVFRNAINLHLH